MFDPTRFSLELQRGRQQLVLAGRYLHGYYRSLQNLVHSLPWLRRHQQPPLCLPLALVLAGFAQALVVLGLQRVVELVGGQSETDR